MDFEGHRSDVSLDFRISARSAPEQTYTNEDWMDVDEISDLLLTVNREVLSVVWKHDVLKYIAGYIVRNIRQKLPCPQCVNSLLDYGNCSRLIFRKDRGGLIIPSDGVNKLIETTEKVLRHYIPKNASDWKLPTHRFIDLRTESRVLQFFGSRVYDLFPELNGHELDASVEEENHIIKLVRLIVNTYVKVRLHAVAKYFNRRSVLKDRPSQRKRLNKLILFRNE